jgi:hypothetical protein
MDVPVWENLEKVSAPKYSTIAMTQNACMPDEAWGKVAVPLSKRIREMNVSGCLPILYFFLLPNPNIQHILDLIRIKLGNLSQWC